MQIARQPGRIPIQPTATTYLVAEEATRSAALTYFDADRAFGGESVECKRFWIHNWTRPNEIFQWTVEVPDRGDYDVTLLIAGAAGVRVDVAAGPSRVAVALARDGWDRVTAPEPLTLRAGTTKLTVRSPRPAGGQHGMALKAVELLPRALRPSVQEQLAQRPNTEWFARARYGLMCQCGEWSYPLHGDKKRWPQQINDFDVAAYADMVAESGAGYAVWSATWATYYFPAPIRAIDEILPGHTSERDLIGEIADALTGHGIKLILYYHPGHGQRDWWDKNWVSHRDKVAFFHNWCAVISDIGRRYADKLAGWLFDDGVVYYPAPFERLGAAARAGNPARIISYNPWICARLTDFQDYQFGEGWRGDPDMPIGGTGIYTDGPHKGLQAHGCFELDGPGWGIARPETRLSPPQVTAEQAVDIATQAAERNQVLSWNVVMYEDGFVSSQSLDVLRAVRKAIRGR